MEIAMAAIKWGSVRVLEVMHHEVRRTDPDTCLADAAGRMRDLDVGCLPVLEDDELIGIITDRDITCRAVAEAGDLTVMTVRDAMSKDVASCFENQEVSHAASVMREKRIRRLPVLDHHNHLVGMLTLSDLSINSPSLAGEVVRSLIPRN